MQTTMMKSLLTSAAFALAVALVAAAPEAKATTIHGNFMGATVGYMGVTESSTTDATPLYGTPVTIGDTLSFFQPGPKPNPSLGFGASAPPSDTTDGFLSFNIMAKAGNVISDVDFSEGGDYSMSGLGGALAQVSANLIVQEISITHVDGAPISPVITDTSLDSVVVNSPPTGAGLWNLSSSFDIDQMLIDAGISYTDGATKILVKLNNTLQALAQPDAAASIVKKGFDVDVETRDVVPEPASCALAVLGLTMILSSRKRKV